MRRRFAFASLIIPRLVQLALGVSIALSFFTQTLAQNDPQNPDRTARPTVTASQSQDLVRFTAPGNVTHMRLEVFSSLGVRVLDTEIKGGNVLDWVLQDKDGQRLGSGAYLCVVTVKSLSGKLSQRFGLVSIDEKQVTLQPVESAQLATAQQHARFERIGASVYPEEVMCVRAGNVKRVASAVGEGSIAVSFVHQFLAE